MRTSLSSITSLSGAAASSSCFRRAVFRHATFSTAARRSSTAAQTNLLPHSQARAGFTPCSLTSATGVARGFSSSRPRSTSSGRTTVKDPEPQSGLYYHPTQIHVSRGPNQPESTMDGWAISFLSRPPSSEDAVIAYVLPNDTSSQDAEPADFVRVNPDRVRINPTGWKIMHDVLKYDVVPNDELLQFEAATRESGWAHLTDRRHPLMPGRIATPENIIASVAFTEGELNVESYEENKSYRLVTGYEGPIQMADSWIEKLRKRFEAL